MASLKKLLLLALPAALAGGCRTYTNQTELNQAGPPMIRQVRLLENVVSQSGSVSDRSVFAFGTHPDALDFEQGHNVTTASPLNGVEGRQLRVIMDELLVGNYLERIGCSDGTYSDVPIGATPDDIAACAESKDILATTCTGPYAVCLGLNGPIGILDNEPRPIGDGAADRHQFIDDSVQVICDGKKVPLDVDASFWQPSGNQLKPAQGGLDVLGPAVVLFPKFGLPTSAECHFKFSETVVDRDDNQVCAPANGDVSQPCTPGDTSLAKFTVDKLRLLSTYPIEAGPFNRTDPATMKFNALIDPLTATGITLKTAAGVAVTSTLEVNGPAVTLSGLSLLPNTAYKLTIPNTIHDRAGGKPLDATVVISFTTGA
jgi:hypothetical protein